MRNIKEQLRPLVWDKNGKFWIAYGAGICYTISGFDGVVTITINNLVKQAKGDARSSDTKTVTSYAEALDFVQNTHYPHFMSDWIVPTQGDNK